MKKLGCIIWILAFIFVASFFKISLLWVVALPFLYILVCCGIMGALYAVGWTYAKITQRSPKIKILPPQDYPPFGELKWADDNWEGQIVLSAWAGFQSRKGSYGSQDTDSPSDGSVTVNVKPAADTTELTPTEAQCRAMKFQIEHGEEVVESILVALLPYYREVKRDNEVDDEYMPPVSSVDDFRKMIGLSCVNVRPYAADGIAYIGLELGCDWEEEHGLGIVMHGSRVVEIGEAEIAFSWRPAEQQSSLSDSNVKSNLS